MSSCRMIRPLALLLSLCLLILPVCAVPTDAEQATGTSSLALSAQAAALLDAGNCRLLYGKDANVRLPMASTTKIMTALVVIDCLPVQQAVCIDARAVGIEGSSIYLYEGEWLTVEQLLYALLLESANDAAVALALAVDDSIPAFAERMNRKAAELKLTDTHFTNPHGLDDEQHYTTAHDLARIAAALLKNPTLKKIVSTKKMTIPLCSMTPPDATPDTAAAQRPVGTRVLLNHNKMLRYYDGAIGVKTGYTKRSGRCLVSAAERDGLLLIAVTLNAPDDWRDHTALLDYGFDSYVRVSLCQKNDYRTLLPVSGGVEKYTLVCTANACSLTLPRDHAPITCTVQLPHLTLAPVYAKKTIGHLVFYSDTNGDGRREQIATVDLQPAYDVEPLPTPSLLQRIRIAIAALFSKKYHSSTKG